MRVLINIIALLVIFSSCENQKQSQEPVNNESIQDKLIEKHKANIILEDTTIDQYVVDHNWEDVQKTGTGLRYWIYDSIAEKSNLAVAEQMAIFKYKVFLLNDSLIYQNADKPSMLIIDNGEGPTGLHEGLKLMRIGDKAKFCMPSRLAYGLTGDQIKIPMNTSIVYDVELLSVQ